MIFPLFCHSPPACTEDTVRFLFDPIDTNRNSVIEYDKFTKWYEMNGFDNKTAKVLNDFLRLPFLSAILGSKITH